MDDLRLRIAEYFKLSKENKEELIRDLARYYYQRWVDEENKDVKLFTIEELIFRFEIELKMAEKFEAYERAEIYHHLLKIYHQLKEQVLDE